MSICASGSSVAKAGVPAALVVDQTYIQSLLPPALSALYPYLPYMHGLEIGDVGAFCAADPPTFTVPSALDFFNFITGNQLSQGQVVNDFLVKLTQYFLWYRICQCSSGATPTSSNPTLPTGLPVINPPVAVGPPVTAGCGTYQSPQTDMLPSNAWVSLLGTVNGVATPLTYIPTPAGATSAVVTFTKTPNGTQHTNQEMQCQFYTAANAFVSSVVRDFHVGDPPTFTQTIALGGTVAKFVASATTLNVGPTSTDLADVNVVFYCSQAPGATQSPCCPPDPIATGLMSQILQMVTLIQRRSLPFAYIASTAHAGLTGQGTIAVADLLGVRVDLTTVPPYLGQEVGEPTVIFDAGWISLLTPDGLIDERRLRSQHTVWTPRLMSEATLIGYSLAPGAVATVTELNPEAA